MGEGENDSTHHKDNFPQTQSELRTKGIHSKWVDKKMLSNLEPVLIMKA